MRCNHRPPQGRVPVIRHGGHASGPRRPATGTPVVSASRCRSGIALGAALAAAMLGALAPASVLGGTSLDARCDGAALRSKPSSSSHREARLPRDARVVATKVVKGGHWKTQCARLVRRRPQVVPRRQRQRQGGLAGCTARRPSTAPGACSTSSTSRSRPPAAGSACGRTRTPRPRRRSSCRPAPGSSRRARSPAGAGAPTATGASRGTQLVPDHEDRHPERVVDVRRQGALRGARAACGPPRSRCRRPARHVAASSRASTSATGRTRSTGPEVAAAGKKFAFMKASEGTKYVDPTYATNRAQANANGIKVGAYHFAKPGHRRRRRGGRGRPLHRDGGPGPPATCCPVLDLEVTGGLGTDASCRPGSRRSSTGSTRRPAERAMIYTSPNFWTTNMGNTTSFAAAGYAPVGRPLDERAVADRARPPTGAGTAGRSGSTRRTGACPASRGRVDLDRYRYADFGRVLRPLGDGRAILGRRSRRLDCCHMDTSRAATSTAAGMTPGRARTRSSTSSARRSSATTRRSRARTASAA